MQMWNGNLPSACSVHEHQRQETALKRHSRSLCTQQQPTVLYARSVMKLVLSIIPLRRLKVDLLQQGSQQQVFQHVKGHP